MKAADVVTFFIGHDDRDQHLLYVDTDGFLLNQTQHCDEETDRVHL